MYHSISEDNVKSIVKEYERAKYIARKFKNGSAGTFHLGMAFALEEVLEMLGFDNYTDVRSGKFTDEILGGNNAKF